MHGKVKSHLFADKSRGIKGSVQRKTPSLSFEICDFQLKFYSDQKILFFSSSDFESVFVELLTGKIFGFCGPPLLTSKADRLDLRRLDLRVSDVIYSLV